MQGGIPMRMEPAVGGATTTTSERATAACHPPRAHSRCAPESDDPRLGGASPRPVVRQRGSHQTPLTVTPSRAFCPLRGATKTHRDGEQRDRRADRRAGRRDADPRAGRPVGRRRRGDGDEDGRPAERVDALRALRLGRRAVGAVFPEDARERLLLRAAADVLVAHRIRVRHHEERVLAREPRRQHRPGSRVARFRRAQLLLRLGLFRVACLGVVGLALDLAPREPRRDARVRRRGVLSEGGGGGRGGGSSIDRRALAAREREKKERAAAAERGRATCEWCGASGDSGASEHVEEARRVWEGISPRSASNARAQRRGTTAEANERHARR